MKQFFKCLWTRPLALFSFISLCLIYIVMIFAEFFAPYSATHSFPEETFHPANIEISTK